MYKNRIDAGKQLAETILERGYESPFIFALVRGGVPIGLEVAKKLNARLEPLVIRKLGVPTFPELGFGAIAPRGILVTDEALVDRLGLDHEQIQAVKTSETKEMLRRIKEYKTKTDFGDLSSSTAIIVDDGIATGISTLAAIRFLRKFNPKRLIVAVPVCPTIAAPVIEKEVDEFICLDRELYFGGVGQFYEEFEQVSDAEVKDLLSNG